MKKTMIKMASFLAPNVMTNIAYKALTRPGKGKIRPHEEAILHQAHKETIQFLNFDIQVYQWGRDIGPVIMLIHGWEGQAGNFADIIKDLVDEGYHVVAFDGPSHGNSSSGETSLFEFSKLVGQMLHKYQPKKLISHSLGGVVTTYALYNNPEIRIDKYVLLTTPDRFEQRIDDIARAVGISDSVKRQLISKVEHELNVDVSSFAVSNFVRNINVNKALIIHDDKDKIIPIHQSAAVCANWDVCTFKPVTGTGHFRILRTPSVIQDIVEYLN